MLLKQTERQQRIIYSGQLLQDDVKLKDILRQVGVVLNLRVACLTNIQIVTGVEVTIGNYFPEVGNIARRRGEV